MRHSRRKWFAIAVEGADWGFDRRHSVVSYRFAEWVGASSNTTALDSNASLTHKQHSTDVDHGPSQHLSGDSHGLPLLGTIQPSVLGDHGSGQNCVGRVRCRGGDDGKKLESCPWATDNMDAESLRRLTLARPLHALSLAMQSSRASRSNLPPHRRRATISQPRPHLSR